MNDEHYAGDTVRTEGILYRRERSENIKRI